MVALSVVSIVGTVLALAVAILLLSGLALYVAFRIRETFREEKGGSARAAKVAFLVGLLFLSGGVFYFFASGFSAPGIQTVQTGSTTTSSSALITQSTLSSSTTTSLATTTTTATSTDSGAQGVTMPVPSCQGSRVTAGSTFTCEIYVYDQGNTAFDSGTVVSSGDFAKFVFLNCTESVNGGPDTLVPTSSTTISVGSVEPGTTVLTLTVRAPSQSGQYNSCVLTLNAPGLSQPISATFSIQVTA